MSNPSFPKQVTVPGITGIHARIYRNHQTKNGKRYVNYTLAYSLLGKMKRETFADLAEAQAVGEAAIKRISNSEQKILELKNRDRDIYMRATELIAPFGIDLDVVAQEWVDTKQILNGAASPPEAARDYVKNHSKKL